MRVVGEPKLSELAKRQPNARKRVSGWLKVAKDKIWTDFIDLKKTYQQADGGVKGKYTVFNLGNEYRIVTAIDYELGIVAVIEALTHEEYDLWNTKKK